MGNDNKISSKVIAGKSHTPSGVDSSITEVARDRVERSDWGQAKSQRDRQAERGDRGSEGASKIGIGPSEAMRAAFETSLLDLRQSAHVAWMALEEETVRQTDLMEKTSARSEPMKRLAVRWQEGAQELAAARMTLAGFIGDAAREGLLEECRFGLCEAFKQGARLPVEGVLNGMSRGALHRLRASEAGEQPEGSSAALERSLMSSWIADQEFWVKANSAWMDPTGVERSVLLRDGAELGRAERNWTGVIEQAVSLALWSSETTDLATGLLGRLAAILARNSPSFSWESAGEQSSLLAILPEGIDLEAARRAMGSAPLSYGLGLRSKIIGLGMTGDGARALSDMILERALNISEQEEGGGVLARHLWLSLDMEGLRVWDERAPGAPLQALGSGAVDWRDPRSAMRISKSLERADLDWIKPALYQAGLLNRAGDENLGAWIDEGFERRIKHAFEGAYALMQTKELNAQTKSGARGVAKPGKGSL